MLRFFVLILTFNLFAAATGTEVLYVVLGQDLLYSCPVSGTPRSSIIWNIEGNIISNSSQYTIYPNGSLLISPITQGHLGPSVTNQCCLDGICQRLLLFLTFINIPTAEDTSAVEFSDITLVCGSNTSQPGPLFSWFRNGTKISSSRETTLMAATRADAGVYTCVVTNLAGTKSKDIQVTVEYVPSAEITGAKNRFVRLGATVELSCSFDGLPTPAVNWYFSRIDPTFSTPIQISNTSLSYPNSKSVTLNFPSISYNQTGYYLCSASNKYGESTSIVRVTVQTIPQRPLVSIASVQSRSFTISWSYGDNGNSPLAHTFIEYKLSTASIWINNLIVGNDTTGYTPTGLLANSLYFIRVSVDNEIGRSLPNMTSARTRPIAPPVPRGVRLRVVSHVTLELVWEVPLLTFEHTSVQGYECQLKPTSVLDWGSAIKLSDTQLSWSFSDLNPGTLYQSRVRCNNSEGYSEWVTVENQTNHTTPGSPILSVTPLDFKSVRVSWTAGSDGGVSILNWTLEIFNDSMEWTHINTFDASQKSYDIDNLKPNTSYLIRIRVRNERGFSPFVSTQVTTISKSPLGVVDKNSIIAVSITSNSIYISWLPVDYSDIAVSIEYRIFYSLLSESLLPTHNVSTDQTSYRFMNLQPLSTYRFAISVRDGEDMSDESVVFSFTTTLPDLNIRLTPDKPILGDELKLSCVYTEKYRGRYEPDFVSWYRGDVHLVQGVQGTSEYFYVYKHHLVFPKFHTSHNGNYTCRVGGQLAYKSVSAKSIDPNFQIWIDHMETIIIAVVLGLVLVLFICLFSFILCCVFCARRRRKAQNARYPVGIPTKSWFNPSTYSPLRPEQAGFNPLKTETSSHVPPRDSILDGDADYPEREPTYTTSFLHNRNISPDLNPSNGAVPNALPPHLERNENGSSASTPGPPLPPPFSAEEVFGDNLSLPKRLTITEGMPSLRPEKDLPPSPPSSVRTAPNYENFSADSDPQYQNLPAETDTPQPSLYQNIPVGEGAQHVLGVEMIQIPHNCISTDI